MYTCLALGLLKKQIGNTCGKTRSLSSKTDIIERYDIF